MKILLAYGSALSRIDDMKLLGGVSGGRTGQEILETVVRSPEWEFKTDKSGHAVPTTKDHDLRVLTNPWTKHPHWPGETHTFRTWEEYQKLLYRECDQWRPDVVICAVAVSNYTPRYVVEEAPPFEIGSPSVHVPRVRGKVDSRRVTELLIKLKKTPHIIDDVRNRIGMDAVLVGFKLTSHGDIDQLIEHARGVLDDAYADLVIANDLKLGLDRKFFVTPVGWWEGKTENIVKVATRIRRMKDSGFYRTIPLDEVGDFSKKIALMLTPGTHSRSQILDADGETMAPTEWDKAVALWDRLRPFMPEHGCFAYRVGGPPKYKYTERYPFITTTRGKQIVHPTARFYHEGGGKPLTVVWDIDHEDRVVCSGRDKYGGEKATLNAPLLAKLFEREPNHRVIVHLHRYIKGAPMVDYVPPGTVAEAALAAEAHYPADENGNIRDLQDPMTLNIRGHGSVACFQTTDEFEIMAWVGSMENWYDPR